MFLIVIAPSPKNPKQNIDIYLQPLIEDLKTLCRDGIVTFEVSKRSNFCLRAALMWKISDFPHIQCYQVGVHTAKIHVLIVVLILSHFI